MRDHGGGTAARNDGEQVVPSADDSASVAFNQLLQRDRHFLLDGAGVVDVAGDVEELGAGIPGPSEGEEPFATAAADGRSDGDRFHVGDRRRAAKDAHIGRKRGLESGFALLPFQRLDEGRLFAADVSAGSAVHENVEIVAGTAGVLADEAVLVRLLDGDLDVGRLVVKLAADVNVGGPGSHGPSGDQAALDELVRIVAHDFAILARARLSFVGVDDEIARPAVAGLVHKAPLHPAGESSTTSASEPRFLHLI